MAPLRLSMACLRFHGHAAFELCVSHRAGLGDGGDTLFHALVDPW